MIISASRRTDIPAFYSSWLINRLQAGYVYVKNPLNPKQISQISLHPKVVDCIVFWTKNAAPMLEKLDCIDKMGYHYYFQWTITPYERNIEPNLPDKEKVIDSFKFLSEKIGSQRVIWRYDPVIVSHQVPFAYHVQEFSKMCALLSGYTSKCIFSYLDLYRKIKKDMQNIVEAEIDATMMRSLAGEFARIAKRYHISLETCAEEVELSGLGIKHASCIDQKTIEDIIGIPLIVKQDEQQRPHCRCITSVDIGAYDSCMHGCVYCYATSNVHTAIENRKKHDSYAPLLLDNLSSGDRITVRTMKSLQDRQGSLY